MLFAAEGGGFFSASASGYSKGLTLLLFGEKSKDRSMRVSPWNHYQLVDRVREKDLPLASTKNWLSRGCASFVCFGCASAALDASSSMKVGTAQQKEGLPGTVFSGKDDDDLEASIEDENDTRKFIHKSSLKKRSSSAVSEEISDEHEELGKNLGDSVGNAGRRRVQWTDACGSELVETREFEPSEMGLSDDEFDNANERSCSCTIM